MKTRTSKRIRSSSAKKPDPESSSEEDARPRRGRRRARNRDAAFQLDDAADDEIETPASASSTHSPGEKEARSRRRLSRPAAATGSSSTAAPSYIDIGLVPSDSHPTKGYVGPYDRGMRGRSLIKVWYGPQLASIQTAQRLLDRWIGWPVLPPKLLPADKELAEGSPWCPDFFDRESQFLERWRGRVGDGERQCQSATRHVTLSADDAKSYQLPPRPLPLLLGPLPSQMEFQFQPGEATSLSQAGIPLAQDTSEAKIPIGWMLDTGGIVLGIDWAPRRKHPQSQLLALAVIPHADQEDYDYEAEYRKPDFEKHGIVQLWDFEADQSDTDLVRPSTLPPRLRQTLCLDYGRARRVRWSPAGDHLAILCGDGRVCVVEVDDETDERFESVLEPLASLSLIDQAVIKATAMAWATFNRLVVGYSDGSVALWSIQPLRLLSRHAVHHSHVVDIATGYPTMPFLVASSPIGGSTKLLDLCRASCETTEVQVKAVNCQPNMLAWSDHLLGFFSVYPSANALNTSVGFMHHRHFPITRRIFTGDCFLSCIAVGRMHPFLLIGTTDGSLWSFNPQAELFKSRHHETERIRIFQHEYKPASFFQQGSPASARGACRLLHGFGVENKQQSGQTEAKTAPVKKGKKLRKNDDEPDEDDAGGPADPTRGKLNEALTRLTAVEWNPNQGYGCWAAAAMGSGLVRVLDLGIENVVEDES